MQRRKLGCVKLVLVVLAQVLLLHETWGALVVGVHFEAWGVELLDVSILLLLLLEVGVLRLSMIA